MEVIKVNLYSPKEYKSNQEAIVTFEIINESEQDIVVLKRNTPLEGLRSDCLIVIKDDTKVPYDGLLVKRGKPNPADYILLKPKEKISAQIDITQAYDISGAKDIKVEFDRSRLIFFPARPTSSKESFSNTADVPAKPELESAGTSFEVEDTGERRLTLGEQNRDDEEEKKTTIIEMAEAITIAVPKIPEIHDATSRQETKIRSAHKNGFKLVKDALAALEDNEDYQTWFGVHTKPRFRKVTETFQQIKDRMESTTFKYYQHGSECAVDGSDYAYTFIGSRKIYFCEQFWEASDRGISSKAGTIIHEHSHASAKTDDLDYGEDECRLLARNHPEKAMKNADNFEFFAEGS